MGFDGAALISSRAAGEEWLLWLNKLFKGRPEAVWGRLQRVSCEAALFKELGPAA